jgi:ribosomal protein S24E
MELKILTEIQNPLFKRKEIIGTINEEVTPSKIDVEKLISEKFSTTPEKIAIKIIKGSFGSKDFKVQANIYENSEDKETTELKSKKQRDAEKKASLEAVKEKVDEAPKESVDAPKEEIKSEEKTIAEKPSSENSDNNGSNQSARKNEQETKEENKNEGKE